MSVFIEDKSKPTKTKPISRKKYDTLYKYESNFKWVCTSQKGPYYAHCRICCLDVCIRSVGSKGLRSHETVKRHLARALTGYLCLCVSQAVTDVNHEDIDLCSSSGRFSNTCRKDFNASDLLKSTEKSVASNKSCFSLISHVLNGKVKNCSPNYGECHDHFTADHEKIEIQCKTSDLSLPNHQSILHTSCVSKVNSVLNTGISKLLTASHTNAVTHNPSIASQCFVTSSSRSCSASRVHPAQAIGQPYIICSSTHVINQDHLCYSAHTVPTYTCNIINQLNSDESTVVGSSTNLFKTNSNLCKVAVCSPYKSPFNNSKISSYCCPSNIIYLPQSRGSNSDYWLLVTQSKQSPEKSGHAVNWSQLQNDKYFKITSTNQCTLSHFENNAMPIGKSNHMLSSDGDKLAILKCNVDCEILASESCLRKEGSDNLNCDIRNNAEVELPAIVSSMSGSSSKTSHSLNATADHPGKMCNVLHRINNDAQSSQFEIENSTKSKLIISDEFNSLPIEYSSNNKANYKKSLTDCNKLDADVTAITTDDAMQSTAHVEASAATCEDDDLKCDFCVTQFGTWRMLKKHLVQHVVLARKYHCTASQVCPHMPDTKQHHSRMEPVKQQQNVGPSHELTALNQSTLPCGVVNHEVPHLSVARRSALPVVAPLLMAYQTAPSCVICTQTTSLHIASPHTTSPRTTSLHTASIHTASIHTTSPHTASPHTTSPHTASPHTTSPHTTSLHTTSPHTTSFHTTSPHTTSLQTASPHTTSPHTTSPHTTSLHTTSPHTTSPHTTSPHTTSPHTASPHTASPHTASPHTASPHTPSPHTASPHTTSPHTTSPHTTSLHTTSPHTASPHTTSPHTTSPHTTSPHTTSPHTTSPHTTSPRTTSPHTTSLHTTSPHTTSLHTTSLHTTSPHTCSVCHRSFSSRANLNTHSILHTGERRFSCSQCPARFARKCSLQNHERYHRGERLYTCDRCGAGFFTSHSLTRHQRLHTGERSFVCTSCSRSYVTLSDLRRHLLTHDTTRPFPCGACGRAFLRRHDLKVHQRQHQSPALLLPCQHCGRQFRQRSNLHRHLRRHTGARPYGCPRCKHTFAQLHSAKRHLRVCHADAPMATPVFRVASRNRRGYLLLEESEDRREGVEQMVPPFTGAV